MDDSYLILRRNGHLSDFHHIRWQIHDSLSFRLQKCKIATRSHNAALRCLTTVHTLRLSSGLASNNFHAIQINIVEYEWITAITTM